MAALNRCTFIGNLGRDPEVRYATDGKAVANFSLGCNESWKDKATGEKKEHTEWVRCVCYERLADIVGEYLKKGSAVYVEGKLRTRKWQDKDGQDRYTTEIIVNSLQMLGGRSGGGEAPAEREAEAKPAAKSAPAKKAATADTFADDDIPF